MWYGDQICCANASFSLVPFRQNVGSPLFGRDSQFGNDKRIWTWILSERFFVQFIFETEKGFTGKVELSFTWRIATKIWIWLHRNGIFSVCRVNEDLRSSVWVLYDSSRYGWWSQARKGAYALWSALEFQVRSIIVPNLWRYIECRFPPGKSALRSALRWRRTD